MLYELSNEQVKTLQASLDLAVRQQGLQLAAQVVSISEALKKPILTKKVKDVTKTDENI